MGEIFDRLVEYQREKHYPDLSSILRNCALFEVPFCIEELISDLKEKRELTDEDYYARLRRHFDISAQNNKFFAMPARITAIEDPTSVVILSNPQDNVFDVIHYGYNVEKGAYFLLRGDIKVTPNIYAQNPSLEQDINFTLVDTNCGKSQTDLEKCLGEGLCVAVEQTIYIMDQSNWIIKIESSPYKHHKKKQESKSKKDNKPQKTELRPRYVVVDDKGVKKVFSEKEGYTPNFVIGHYRTLVADCFKRIDGRPRVITVEQYWRGATTVEYSGKTYTILLKDKNNEVRITSS
jgi:hypothetical protein